MKTNILETSQENYNETLLEEPAKAIREGKIVIFPTETVYGMAVDLNNTESIKRLFDIKQRPIDKQITTHIWQRDDIVKYTRKIPGYAQRMIRRFWPGPLTLIFTGINEETVGIRFPSNKIAQTLIMKSNVRVGAPSANISGESPCTSGNEAINQFDGKVDWIISSGKTTYSTSSTIVKAISDDPEIVREGAIYRSLIEDLSYKLIIFVCTGNTCRSPMAEAILKEKLSKNTELSSKYKVISAGIAASTGMSASENALKLAKEYGAFLESHRSQPLTISMVEEAHTVYVMTMAHKNSIEEWLPYFSHLIKRLDPESDIDDPIGQDINAYRACAKKIKNAIDKYIKL